MFSVPPRVPVEEGVNVILIVQIAPAGTLPPQESCSAKSEAFVPTIATLERVRTVFPVLLKVTVCATLVAPIMTFANVKALTERLAIRLGATPVPLSGTGTGLPERLFAMASVATRVPAADGIKATLIEQLAAAGTLPTQLSDSVKSEALVPVTAIPAILRVVESLFVIVTVCFALAVPITWLAKDRLDGERPISSYNSALLKSVLFWSVPPVTSTVPLFSCVAVWAQRDVFMAALGIKVFVAVLYNSALL
jgi:hypothetical protein